MWKKVTCVFGILAFLSACAGKEGAPIAEDLPTSSYKEELAGYRAAQEAKKPVSALWTDSGSRGTLFMDYKARLIGDIITVRIVESASAKNSNNTATNRSANYGAEVTNLLGLPLNMGMENFLGSGQPFNPAINATTSNAFSGQGSKARSDTLNATIAARVIEILPYGDLLIEGRREIVIDQEKQTIAIRGIVRQKDIDSSNTVPSSAIADAQIKYYGDGVISDANRKGWLATFVDWIWPF